MNTIATPELDSDLTGSDSRLTVFGTGECHGAIMGVLFPTCTGRFQNDRRGQWAKTYQTYSSGITVHSLLNVSIPTWTEPSGQNSLIDSNPIHS